MARIVKPKPCGPRRMMVGGLSELIKGVISLEGEVSRDEAVLDPPGDWMGSGKVSSVGIINDNPDAEALLITGRDLCLTAGDEGGMFTRGINRCSEAPGFSSTGDSSRKPPLSKLGKSRLNKSSSPDIENLGKESLECE